MSKYQRFNVCGEIKYQCVEKWALNFSKEEEKTVITASILFFLFVNLITASLILLLNSYLNCFLVRQEMHFR